MCRQQMIMYPGDDVMCGLQILLGVRDTDDRLVSLSLRSLAELVDILGGDIVIGINRLKVFTDGLPKVSSNFLLCMWKI